MQIHVVRQNDSLSGIAMAYSTTTQDLIDANELQNPNQLVIGQTLVIPIIGSFYWVQPGDTLYLIAQRYGLTVEELVNINQISQTNPLRVGLRLYIPERPKTSAEINAYVEPRGDTVSENLIEASRGAAPHLTYLAPFNFQALRDGSLQEPPLDELPAIAEQNQNVLMMVISNQENAQFSDELASILLNDQNIQNTFLDNIVATAKNTTSKISILILSSFDQKIKKLITNS